MADDVAFQTATAVYPPSTLTVAADDVSSKWYQRIKRSVGADGSATDFLDKVSRSDTYTGTGNGTAVDVSAQGMSRYALQVKQTGTVTSWQVDLQISLDGTNYFTIASHTKAVDGDGAIVNVSFAPGLYVRTSCAALTLGGGTNVVATLVALP